MSKAGKQSTALKKASSRKGSAVFDPEWNAIRAMPSKTKGQSNRQTLSKTQTQKSFSDPEWNTLRAVASKTHISKGQSNRQPNSKTQTQQSFSDPEWNALKAMNSNSTTINNTPRTVLPEQPPVQQSRLLGPSVNMAFTEYLKDRGDQAHVLHALATTNKMSRSAAKSRLDVLFTKHEEDVLESQRFVYFILDRRRHPWEFRKSVIIAPVAVLDAQRKQKHIAYWERTAAKLRSELTTLETPEEIEKMQSEIQYADWQVRYRSRSMYGPHEQKWISLRYKGHELYPSARFARHMLSEKSKINKTKQMIALDINSLDYVISFLDSIINFSFPDSKYNRMCHAAEEMMIAFEVYGDYTPEHTSARKEFNYIRKNKGVGRSGGSLVMKTARAKVRARELKKGVVSVRSIKVRHAVRQEAQAERRQSSNANSFNAKSPFSSHWSQ